MSISVTLKAVLREKARPLNIIDVLSSILCSRSKLEAKEEK